MRFEENQILELFNSLKAAEQDELIRLLTQAFRTEISLTPEALAASPLEQLMPMRDIIRGYVLTKKNVPDIKQAYAAMHNKNLPRKIRFGLVKESTKNDD
ncbi:hypothetical protein M3194_07060 [Paenibacillus glycanilyticus]|uniref:hypothetical protein n=1 Tax=Paenibacillus glycanilyticus TaxID=126569 RepID=UPI0020422732|nr:hypothetical protein [Paenibacillus glycanilyticus]MCM3627119.1 hypothetical protein [Paenibacillus glycanilyticus]